MFTRYEVEWSYTNLAGYCYTEGKAFETAEEQQKFASEKYDEESVYEVRLVTETVWRKEN